MSISDSRDHLRNPHHLEGTRTMTDTTVPDVTDDDRRVAYEWAASIDPEMNCWSDRERAAARVILQAVPEPPKPPTLADEISEYAENLLAGASVSDVELQLIHFADRVETLEQVHDAAQAEIARLRAREIPDGWRIAEHPEYGTVLTAERPDKDGYTHYAWLETSLHDLIHRGWGAPAELTFRDEAPAPEPEMDAQ